MERKTSIGKVVLLSVLCILAEIYAVGLLTRGDGSEPSRLSYFQGEKYTMYIGTNDKDTYTQLISLEDAKETVNEICSRYVSGYTVQEANGGWVDETGTLTQEHTLVYSFYGVEEEDMISIMDEVLLVLNQNSIMVEHGNVNCTYYSGK